MAASNFFFKLLKTNMSSAYALKFNFWLETISMAINNTMAFGVWIILFYKFPEINGWNVHHLVLMQGVCMCAYAMWAFSFVGIGSYLAGYIERGELDTFILQPKNILLNVAMSRSQPSAAGDALTGILFMAFSGLITLLNFPVACLAVFLGFMIFITINLFIGSLGFYFNDVEGWGDRILSVFTSLSTQPGSIYTGAVRMFLMYVFPAGLLTFMPVEMIANPSVSGILTSIGITSVFFALSVWFFYRGLKRYESGNAFGVRS